MTESRKLSAQILLVHPNPAARQEIAKALRENNHQLQCRDYLPLMSADKYRSADIDILLLASEATDSLDSLLQWSVHSLPDATRLFLIANPSFQHKLQHRIGREIDDYILEPLDFLELQTRVEAAMTRTAVNSQKRLRIGPIDYDISAHVVSVESQAIDLAPAEFRLMKFFLGNPGRVYSRPELLKYAWGDNTRAGQRTVDVHVRRLRQILEKYGWEKMIQTVRGFGYRFSDKHCFTSTKQKSGIPGNAIHTNDR